MSDKKLQDGNSQPKNQNGDKPNEENKPTNQITDKNSTDQIQDTTTLDSYNQTHKALKEALSEQTILKQRLRVLEMRNKPAKLFEPIVIHSIASTRGHLNDEEFSPERILLELTKATNMLENAKIASESSEIELRELLKATENYKQQSVIDTEIMVSQNAFRHKKELQSEQQLFQSEIQLWNKERSELLAQAEEISLMSQSALHKSTLISEQVEQQRRQIQKLAADLRVNVKHSKELRDKLEDSKRKVALIQSLSTEIEANNKKTEELEKAVTEQKAILKAVRISQQAQSILDENKEQIKELRAAKEDAKEKLATVMREKKEAEDLEKLTIQKIADAKNRFKIAQSKMFVLEADVRELKAEYAKQRQAAIDQGRKNVDLQCKLKNERIDATQRFIFENCNQIHKVERVQSTLIRVKKKLQSRPSSAIQYSQNNNNNNQLKNKANNQKNNQQDQQSQKAKLQQTLPSAIKTSNQQPNSTRRVTFKINEFTPRKV